MYIKYKLHMTEKGMRCPPWVEDGGYFVNGNEFIGWTPDEANREYYVPDTVTEYTQAELVTYVQGLTILDEDGNEMSDADVETMVNDWCSTRTG